jgi:hypothetical protein
VFLRNSRSYTLVGAARPKLAWPTSDRLSGRRKGSARPSARTGASAPHCRIFFDRQVCARNRCHHFVDLGQQLPLVSRFDHQAVGGLTCRSSTLEKHSPIPCFLVSDFDGARRGSVHVGGRVAQPCSVIRTRDQVAGAGYACSARPDLHTVCRHFLKSHQLLVQKFAADRDRQKGRVFTKLRPPSAAHFLKSHQLLVQKFAADRDRQKGRVFTRLRQSQGRGGDRAGDDRSPLRIGDCCQHGGKGRGSEGSRES